MKLDISTQMAVEHVPAQKSKENAKWTTQAAKPGNSSGRLVRFFSEKKSSAEFFSPKFLIQLNQHACVQKFQSVLSALTMRK